MISAVPFKGVRNLVMALMLTASAATQVEAQDKAAAAPARLVQQCASTILASPRRRSRSPPARR